MRPGPSPFALLRARAKFVPQTFPLVRKPPSRSVSLLPPLPPLPPRPPISTQIRQNLPAIFWWMVITSLAVHLLRARHEGEETKGIAKAKISVLENIIRRLQHGEVLSDDQLRKELEMVGLRKRTGLSEVDEEEVLQAGNVSWREVLFGRKGRVPVDAEQDAVDEWAKVVTEATQVETETTPEPVLPAEPQRTGAARRAPSSSVFLG